MKEKFDAFLKEMPVVAILRGISKEELIVMINKEEK